MWRRPHGVLECGLALDLGRRVHGLVPRVVETVLDEVVALLAQGIDVERRATRLAEEKPVQEGYDDVSINATLTHHVLARKLLDGAVLGVLRPYRRRA